jgi:hypothetical protein
MDLPDLVRDFADALKTVDGRCPQFTSRTGRAYHPGIGPHSDDRAVDLIVAEMQRVNHERYGGLTCRALYPGSRQSCDIVLTGAWMIEVRMARFYGDNDKLDDTAFKDLISPFEFKSLE